MEIFSWMKILNKLKNVEMNPKKKIEEVSLARQYYPRPTVPQLWQAMQSSISFIVARDPLERLVSGFRDKILNGLPYFQSLRKA